MGKSFNRIIIEMEKEEFLWVEIMLAFDNHKIYMKKKSVFKERLRKHGITLQIKSKIEKFQLLKQKYT